MVFLKFGREYEIVMVCMMLIKLICYMCVRYLMGFVSISFLKFFYLEMFNIFIVLLKRRF